MRSTKHFPEFFVLAFALLGLLPPLNGQDQPKPLRKTAAYKGLKTGVSTMQDVARKLGRIKFETLEETNDSTERNWRSKARKVFRRATSCAPRKISPTSSQNPLGVREGFLLILKTCSAGEDTMHAIMRSQ
jgi:hypothetical protein